MIKTIISYVNYHYQFCENIDSFLLTNNFGTNECYIERCLIYKYLYELYFRKNITLREVMSIMVFTMSIMVFTINGVYDEIVHFRRNIFNVLSGRTLKAFIEELTFWIKQFNSNSDLNSVALKAFMVLPTLILQKPSATSKSKEHCAAIERRF